MSWIGVLLALGGVVAYFGLFLLHVPLWQRVPYAFIAVIAAGVLLAIVAAVQRPGLGAIGAAAIAVSLLAFASWYFFSFSIYDARESKPGVGDPFPDFTLTDSTGELFRLMDARGKRLLVLLYRGDW